MFNFFQKQVKSQVNNNSIIFSDDEPEWTGREYASIAKESYCKNVIAHRCISMIAKSVASIPLKIFLNSSGTKKQVTSHALIELMQQPNPYMSCKDLIEEFISFCLISGESYILSIRNSIGHPIELYCIRPDQIKIHYDKNGSKLGYVYQSGEKKILYKIDKISGLSNILMLKNFHPLSRDKGVSQIEAALNSIDQHNQASKWNQTLLQNSARPSGALIMSQGNMMTAKQYEQLKDQIEDCFMGVNNSGRPILLEGGLEWKELALTPKDMDFVESKNTAAREIALALGVPPQLLGIPGDNTYSNFQEARLAFWEDTVLPFAVKAYELLANWFSKMYEQNIELALDTDQVSALATRREALWARLEQASFLTLNEKRAILGFGPIDQNIES
jgi:HK97 family phage portal protein